MFTKGGKSIVFKMKYAIYLIIYLNRVNREVQSVFESPDDLR